MDKVKEILGRHSKKKTARANWDAQWEEIALYSMPGKADFITERSTGDKSRSLEIYDPTAAVSNHTLASHMHSSMTSPAVKWFEQTFSDDEYNTDAGGKWIEKCTKNMFKAINSSNFVSVVNELYQNLIAFGTACIEVTFVIDQVDGFKLVFRDIPLNSLIFMENVHGVVDTVFHERKMTVRQIIQLFGEKTPAKVKEQAKKDPDHEEVVLRCTRPNKDFDPKKKLAKASRRFESIWICGGKEVKTEYFYELPFMVPRWSKMTTEPYGYGPGLLALPDVKSLNEAKRLELRGWEKAIDPPLWGMAGAVVGNLHLEASGFTKVRDRNAIGQINQGTNWTAVQIKANEIRQNIQSVYLIDQLILPERPNATATEVQIRYELMQKVLGPTMGRLQAELLNPLVDRVFNVMLRNNQFPEIPEELSEAETEVKYTGPLARAQTSEEAVAIERLVAFVMGTAQLDPTVADVIDMREAVRSVATQWGAPTTVIRSKEDVEEIDAEREAQMKKQQGQQEAMADAEVTTAQAGATTASVDAMEQVQNR